METGCLVLGDKSDRPSIDELLRDSPDHDQRVTVALQFDVFGSAEQAQERVLGVRRNLEVVLDRNVNILETKIETVT